MIEQSIISSCEYNFTYRPLRGNNNSLVKLVTACRHMLPVSIILKSNKPKRLRSHWYIQIHIHTKSANWSWSWPFNRLQQCTAGVNPSPVVRMETSSTLGPEDSDVSGSVEKGTNNARVRDYTFTLWAKQRNAIARIQGPFPVLHIDSCACQGYSLCCSLFSSDPMRLSLWT